MFKSKIFNSVMRYMLVAMLALLPNAIWGITVQNAVIITSGSSATFKGLNNYITTNDYTAWFVLDASGNKVNITGWSISNPYRDGYENKGTYWVFPKPYYVGDSFTITTAGEDISQYTLVLLASSSEAFFNAPSEATAEKKITFQLVSKDDIPQFGKLTGASIDINKEIADASLAGGSITTDDLCSAISSLNIWSGETTGTLSRKDNSFYLRLSIVDKSGKSVKLDDFTIKRNGADITSQKLDDYLL